jgi:hypothetical protein
MGAAVSAAGADLFNVDAVVPGDEEARSLASKLL